MDKVLDRCERVLVLEGRTGEDIGRSVRETGVEELLLLRVS